MGRTDSPRVGVCSRHRRDQDPGVRYRGMSGRFSCQTHTMNMGGPGDHWYTDIFSWGRPAFGEPIDATIKEIRRYGGDSLLQDQQNLGERLWRLWPHWSLVDEQALGQLAADLASIRDELRTEAQLKGWDLS